MKLTEQAYSAEEAPIEGDRSTWHIRLRRKCGDVEAWQLWNGGRPESGFWPKGTVQKWLNQELHDR
jgi:hypothetical protein